MALSNFWTAVKKYSTRGKVVIFPGRIISFRAWSQLSRVALVGILALPQVSGADSERSICRRLYKEALYKNGIYYQLSKMDSEVYQIFEKARRNPQGMLTDGELSKLREKELEGVFHQWSKTHDWVRNLNREYSLWKRSKLPASNGKKKGWLRRGFSEISQLVFPYRAFFDSDRLGKSIVRKIVANPEYSLNSKEAAYIEKANLKLQLDRLRTDVRSDLGGDFARVTDIRVAGNVAKWSIITSTVGLSLVSNDYTNLDEVKDEKSPKAMSRLDDKVELIFISPMPHASLRIGGTVYNYGVGNVKRYNLKTYSEMVGFGNALSGNYTRVELKLTPEEKEKLQDYLEADVGKIYPLVIPFVDCVSQSNKAIKVATGIDVPWVADRSQAMSIAYYKMRKLLGDPRIGDIRFVSNSSGFGKEKVADAAVNSLDSLLFLRNFGKVFLLAPFLDSVPLTTDFSPKDASN